MCPAVALRHLIRLPENDVHRTPRRLVARDKHRHQRRIRFHCHAHRARLRAHVLVLIAARALDEDHHLLAVFERLHALVIGGSVVRPAVDKDNPELFHHPADDRHLPQLLFRDNPAHLRRIQRQQQPDGIRAAGVVRADHGFSNRNKLPSYHMEHRMPEKQPDPANPPAHPIPERHHPSFLLTMARISAIDCSMVLPEVSSFTASGAGLKGAMVRSVSCLSRAIMSCRTFS